MANCDWVLRRLDDISENLDRLIRPGTEVSDFNGILAGIRWIADGRAKLHHDSYPELDFTEPANVH